MSRKTSGAAAMVLVIRLVVAIGAPCLWVEAVEISPRAVIEESIIDFHAGTGNLFVVLRGFILFESKNFWSVNISQDQGRTWTETYYWEVPESFYDIDAVVVGDHLYVAYSVHAAWPGSARLRRFSVNDGLIDNLYEWHEVVLSPHRIVDLALASNADSSSSRLYYLLLESDGDLRYFYSDEEGGSGPLGWTEIATGVTNARNHLEATYNQLGDTYFLYASYVGTDDNLHVWRRGNGGLIDHTQIASSVTTSWRTGMSAYDDVVLVAYPFGESGIGDIKYRISYNGGEAWYQGTIAAGADYTSPAVTLRNGGGISVVYGQSFNPGGKIWMRQRVYQRGQLWSPPIECTQPGPGPFEGTSTELLPGVEYGVVFKGWSNTAQFTTMSPIFIDGFETGDLSRWSSAFP